MKDRNPDGRQHTRILIGIAMLVLAAAFAYFAVSQPGVDSNVKTTGSNAATQQSEATSAPTAENTETEEASQTNEAPSESITLSQPTEAPATAPNVTEAADDKTTEQAVSVQYPLNLNTCTVAELMTINGIGETRANAIIAYREYLGGYTDVEQLKNISGIGDGIFAKIEPYVTV